MNIPLRLLMLWLSLLCLMPSALAAPADTMTAAEADALVWKLPELKVWAEGIRKQSAGRTHGVTVEYSHDPQEMNGKRYWSVDFGEDSPERFVRLTEFLVRTDGKEILVQSQAMDDYLNLQEWRKLEKPMQRYRDGK